MIISRIIGGLGNQLFQYAVARQLAIKHNTELKLDVSGFSTYKLHDYSLHNFNIVESFASKEEIARLAPSQSMVEVLYRRVLQKKRKYNKTHIVETDSFYFNPDILDLPDNVYIDGYWLSEKYFSDIKNIIHDEFTIKSPLKNVNK